MDKAALSRHSTLASAYPAHLLRSLLLDRLAHFPNQLALPLQYCGSHNPYSFLDNSFLLFLIN